MTIEFIMRSYNEALEMRSRQIDRFDKVELEDREVDGEKVTVVKCSK